MRRFETHTFSMRPGRRRDANPLGCTVMGQIGNGCGADGQMDHPRHSDSNRIYTKHVDMYSVRADSDELSTDDEEER
jgi:transcription elongation factor Elf1